MAERWFAVVEQWLECGCLLKNSPTCVQIGLKEQFYSFSITDVPETIRI